MRPSWQYVLASWDIIHFYLTVLSQFALIHPDLPSGRLIERISEEKPPLRFELGSAFKSIFNDQYDQLRKTIRHRLTEAGAAGVPFERILVGSFAVRALWCLAVWFAPTGSSRLALLSLGLAQFAVAPMSFAVSLLRLGTNAADAVFHYIINAIVFWGLLGGRSSGWSLRIDGRFAVAFLALDLLLNIFVYIQTSEDFGWPRLAKHAVYGTFNCKTYFIVVLGVLSGYELDLAAVALTGAATIAFVMSGLKTRTLRLLRMPCFPVLFYCEHRINHLPIVYAHAHKLHHYLHDTTSFDGHIYGSGMNEEWAWILVETLPCIASSGLLFPYFANLDTLWASWTNKGGHTRTSAEKAGRFGDYDADNFHADHHTLHRKSVFEVRPA